jgi:hypothetical protein
MLFSSFLHTRKEGTQLKAFPLFVAKEGDVVESFRLMAKEGDVVESFHLILLSHQARTFKKNQTTYQLRPP